VGSSVAALLLVAGNAAAFEDMAARPDGLHGSLGLGVGVKPEYSGSKDRETRVMPQISLFYGETLFLTGMTAGANLWKHTTAQGLNLTAGPLLALHRARKEGDNAALAGLGEIDRGLDAGVFLRLRSGPWQARADCLQMGAHSTARIALSKPLLQVAPAWADSRADRGFGEVRG
jgi:outer membrane scaffolding protein for murein synthesis (MipA/OmpV family)